MIRNEKQYEYTQELAKRCEHTLAKCLCASCYVRSIVLTLSPIQINFPASESGTHVLIANR
ncbi:MAG: hypothetical protein ACRC62_27880 [Microcoleus sp.]